MDERIEIGAADPVEKVKGGERPPILDTSFLRYLEQLGIVSKKIFLGRMRGERRSKRRGVSIEFADYRDYAKGDDLRFMDWNIFGRLDRLFTKLFHEEEDLYLYILIDTSRSMDFGDPHKGWFALRAAAALAYIALAGYDRVFLVGFSEIQYRWMQPARGKAQLRRLVDFLENLPWEGETALEEGCRRFALQQTRGGVVILLSDLMDPQGVEGTIKRLLQNRNDLYILQTLSPQELKPDWMGDLRLIDVETDDRVEVSLNEELLRLYRGRLQAFQSQVKTFCTRYGVHYLPVATDMGIERLLSHSFRRLGLIE